MKVRQFKPAHRILRQQKTQARLVGDSTAPRAPSPSAAATWKFLDHTGSGGNRYENNPELKPFILPDTALGAPGQLYDLETDPGEKVNLYFKHPEIVKELKALLEQSKASGRNRLEQL